MKTSLDWSAIDALSVPLREDAVPPNAINAADYAARYRITPRAAHDRLNGFVTAGRMQQGRKRAGAYNRMTSFYWVPRTEAQRA